MDFLVFMGIYLCVFAIVIVLYYTVDSETMKNSSLRFVINIGNFLFGLIPDFFKRNTSGWIDYMFYKRNHILQIVYGSLVLAGHVVLVVDIFPIVYVLAANENHVTMPLIFVLLNTLFFNLTCVSDPGEITALTAKHLSPAYRYDWLMYKPNMKCRTCQIPKLPRSKHCSVCDRCVYRFDHHCIWTNNCIGGLNHFYFILFLLSICAMSVNGVFICRNTLMLVVNHYNMLNSSYVDWEGKVQPVTFFVLAQHLFMKFPRIVFTLVSLIFVIISMGGFALYHIFLMVTNQTTNERYKDKAKLRQAKLAQMGKNGRPTRRDNLDGNLYNQGLYQNVYELMCPKTFLEEQEIS